MDIDVNKVKSEEMKKKAQKNLKRFTGIIVAAVIVLFAAVLAANSFYILNSGEEAIITRFGKYELSVTEAGVRFKIPFVDDVTIVNVSEVRRIEFGYETVGSDGNQLTYNPTDASDLVMITSDECLVMVEASIQYRISDLYTYLYKTANPEATFRVIAESALRRVIASHTMDESMTDNKSTVQLEIKDDLQELCNLYQLGITVSNVQLQDVNPPKEVEEAFKDVSAAREDKNTYINEAASYANEKIPLARGNAESLKNQAEAYKQERVATSEAEVASFLKVYEEYKNHKDITRTRMYLEMIENVIPGAKVIIMDEDTANTNTVLPLDDFASVNGSN